MKLAVLAAVAAGRALAQTPDSGMVDRYLTQIAMKQLAARKQAMERVRTVADIEARQQYIRAKLLEEIGGLPERTPLNPKITGSLARPTYRVDKLIFESEPRYYVTANLYVPQGKGPFPAVVGTAGHSIDGKAEDAYQSAWISLARRGFVVLAFDPPGQGERLEYLDAATGKSRVGWGTAEHMMAGVQCLLTGTNIARYFIWDGMRAIDYLLTRSDVDPKKIAVAGNSGGGTQSAYLGVLEPRLAAAAPSCYLTSWEKMWTTPGPQDAEQDLAGFLRDGLDFPDFLIAFAPKPIQMSTAIQDFFPIEGARATYAEARSVFAKMSAADRMGYFEFDDTHGWSKPRREATYRWFTRWLEGKNDDGVEPADLKPEDHKELLCTQTGQVATAFPGAATIHSINAALADRLCESRPARRDLTALVRARLAIPARRPAPVVRPGKDGRIEIQTEPGITVPARIHVPTGGPARHAAVLYVNAAGKDADPAAIDALVQQGQLVLAIDARGWGESAPPPSQKAGYLGQYQTAMRAFLVGKSPIGMRTEDVLQAFDYLRTRPDVDAAQITVAGKGAGDVAALFAAALEPRIAKVQCESLTWSYREMAHREVHEGLLDVLAPGALRDFDLPDIVASLGDRVGH